jgi:hypothetical protein
VDDLERDVAESLRTLAPAAPPPGLAERILTRTAARRRSRRRRRAVAAITALAACAAAAVAVADLRRDTPPAAVQPPEVTIQRGLPGGQRFKAMAVGQDGTVLGMAISIGRDGETDPREGVWAASPTEPVPRRIAATGPGSLPYLWTMATGDHARVWTDGDRLTCLDSSGGEARMLGAGWTGRERFYTERGLVVWGDASGGVAVASGCDGPTRMVPATGTLAAFSYPDAFVTDGGGRTWQVDVRSGVKSAVPGVPGSPVEMAAGPTALAWVTGGGLTIRDRTTGKDTTSPAFVDDEDRSIQLTVGRKVVAYSSSSQDTDAGLSRVYDLRTGAYTNKPGPALVAGDWLLLQAGDTYRLTRR